MDNDVDIEMVWIPLNTEDVPALERMLAHADPFVPTMIDTRHSYRLADYVQNALYGEHEVRALLDRNLGSRAVALGGGEEVDAQLRYRFERLDVLVAKIEEEIERTCERS